jgi:hypothetical protein
MLSVPGKMDSPQDNYTESRSESWRVALGVRIAVLPPYAELRSIRRVETALGGASRYASTNRSYFLRTPVSSARNYAERVLRFVSKPSLSIAE